MHALQASEHTVHVHEQCRTDYRVTDECAATAACFQTMLSGAQHVASCMCARMIMYAKPMLCGYAESYLWLASSLVEGHYGRPAARFWKLCLSYFSANYN